MDGLIIYAKNSNNKVCTKNTQNVVQLISIRFDELSVYKMNRRKMYASGPSVKLN